MCIKQISEYLLSKVKDGGWRAKPDSGEINPLNTAEVLCGLIKARYILNSDLPEDYDKIIKDAIEYLHNTQTQSGGWATGEDNRTNGKNAIGNTVSTCFALWALILYYDSIGKKEELIDVVYNAIKFLDKCCGDGLYYYSPDLTKEDSIVSGAYILLSYSLILSSEKLTNHKSRSEVLQKILKILKNLEAEIDYDENIIKDKRFFLAILTCYSILELQKTNHINKIKPKFLNELLIKSKGIISKLGQVNCTESYHETQILHEGRKRDFIHYVPIWIHILNSQLEESEQYYAEKVSTTILKNIKDNSVVHIGRDKWIWATGLTLFALAHYS